MANRRAVFGRFVGIAALLCLIVGCTAAPRAISARSMPSSLPTTPLTGDYWFYAPPADRSPYPDLGDRKAKNVILLIGDGMGLGPVAAARIRAVGPNGRLHIDRIPVTGFATTHSASGLITDSGAGGTALATGFKTNNGMLSMLPDTNDVLTILEAAKERKMATGLVVVCPIPHATPAVFAAHTPSRDMYPQIYTQMLENKVDVMLGIGDAGASDKPSGDATQAKKAGYHVVANRNELAAAIETPVVGLLGFEEPSKDSPKPMLAEMTAKAIELLSQDRDGFFLMVEGSDIDWAGHGNDASASARKTLLFDLAIKEALDFALRNKHTLVIVTADHDTGGLTITGGEPDGKNMTVSWISGGHTGLPVPIYAFGPGARRFAGMHDNTEIPCIIAQLLGIKRFPMVLPRK
jgi:alkaline phosphatase